MNVKSAGPWLPLFVSVLSLLQARSSEAVPAFARREGVKCQMCHFRLPELNQDGHAYIQRGFREERGGMTPETGMVMGTREAAKAPAAATARPLGQPLPLEWQDYLTVMGHHTYEARNNERAMFHAGMLDVWIGGPLDQHSSAIVGLEVDMETGGVHGEQAYAQFNTAWSARFASVRVGQLLPFAVLFNGGGAAMPLSRPVVLTAPASVDNPWAANTLIRGAELGVVDLSRWNAYVGVGQPQIEGLMGASHTDVYASTEYLIGEQGNSVSGFGYKGTISASPGQPAVGYDRVALFANVYRPRAKGVLGLLWGNDRPTGGQSLGSAGGFLLGEVLLAERWATYARYDWANRDTPVGKDESTDGPTLGVSFWAQTQVRLSIETQFLQSTGAARDRSATAELMWAF